MTARLDIDFYQTSTGTKPVHDWLRSFPKEDRKIIGDDIRHVQEAWPVGMPICKNMPRLKGCWEMRTRTRRLKSIRIFFTIEDGKAVLLHGFTKKENRTAPGDVCTAQERLRNHQSKRK